MDWQTAQDIVQPRALVGNIDNRAAQYLDTRNFARHDFTVRADLRDDLSVRMGVVNAFDAEPARWLTVGAIYSNFDPYSRRFFIGLNYRPW
jgi:outer membrane receptor protein involved in Fe transport